MRRDTAQLRVESGCWGFVASRGSGGSLQMASAISSNSATRGSVWPNVARALAIASMKLALPSMSSFNDGVPPRRDELVPAAIAGRSGAESPGGCGYFVALDPGDTPAGPAEARLSADVA